jgi:hypothetical protein
MDETKAREVELKAARAGGGGGGGNNGTAGGRPPMGGMGGMFAAISGGKVKLNDANARAMPANPLADPKDGKEPKRTKSREFESELANRINKKRSSITSRDSVLGGASNGGLPSAIHQFETDRNSRIPQARIFRWGEPSIDESTDVAEDKIEALPPTTAAEHKRRSSSNNYLFQQPIVKPTPPTQAVLKQVVPPRVSQPTKSVGMAGFRKSVKKLFRGKSDRPKQLPPAAEDWTSGKPSLTVSTMRGSMKPGGPAKRRQVRSRFYPDCIVLEFSHSHVQLDASVRATQHHGDRAVPQLNTLSSSSGLVAWCLSLISMRSSYLLPPPVHQIQAVRKQLIHMIMRCVARVLSLESTASLLVFTQPPYHSCPLLCHNSAKVNARAAASMKLMAQGASAGAPVLVRRPGSVTVAELDAGMGVDDEYEKLDNRAIDAARWTVRCSFLGRTVRPLMCMINLTRDLVA